MNKRIRELAEQAGFTTDEANITIGNYKDGNEYFYAEDFIEDELKKFAELIVRECMHVILLDGKTIADSMPNANRDNYTMVAEQTGMINASMRYANKIKQHFGVE